MPTCPASSVISRPMRKQVKAANQMTATSQGTPMDLKAFVGTENI